MAHRRSRSIIVRPSSLPSVVTALRFRSSASTMQTILVEILELFLGSDLLPSSVLELVAPDLRSLLASSNIGLSTSIDISKMRKLIAPFVESKLTPCASLPHPR